MPWVNENGKGRWVDYPWISDPQYREKMLARGKGPANWYRSNTWQITADEVGPHTFVIGNGTNPVQFPSVIETDDRNRMIREDRILGNQKFRQKIWSETEGLLCDPILQGHQTLNTYKGSWVTKNDVRLRSRETEILGIIAANPGIRISELALIYNTTTRNIYRILMLSAASGVRFSRLQLNRVNIVSWGIYDKQKIIDLFSKSMGLEDIVMKAKSVFEDIADERTGKIKMDRVKLELREMWKAKLAKQQQTQGE